MIGETSDFQTQIIECVDAGLKELGQSVREVIFFHLEKNFGISKEEIPNQPEAFSKALHSIFGQGAKVIEGLIVQKIQEKLKLRLRPETSLVDAVHAIRKGLQTTT